MQLIFVLLFFFYGKALTLNQRDTLKNEIKMK